LVAQGRRCPTWFGVSRDDFADDLVTGDYPWIARREFAFYDVQVGSADAASEDS
jgi:hypothetical protein